MFVVAMTTAGKEKLADYLGVGAEEARNITHSFLGPFSSLLSLTRPSFHGR